MTHFLPFKSTDKVIEVGGGDNPACPGRWANVDIRPGPKVDIVCDLNEKLPIESESYDGIYSSFLLEHLRLSKVPQFLSEIHRILKPGGIVCLITANLVEQAKVLIEKEERGEFDEKMVHMVFGGDPDYPENYHKSSMSPKYAIRLLMEAGFREVHVYEHPVAVLIWGKSTDMILECHKGLAVIRRSL